LIIYATKDFAVPPKFDSSILTALEPDNSVLGYMHSQIADASRPNETVEAKTVEPKEEDQIVGPMPVLNGLVQKSHPKKVKLVQKRVGSK
jgi:hypothetical protein